MVTNSTPIETTIPELLRRRAHEQPDDVAYTFVDYESDPAGEAESLTWSELRGRVDVVAAKLSGLGSPGDRAVVLAPQGLDYIVGFLGAIQAGFIAVPLTVPQPGQHDERVVGAMRDCTPVAVLTTSAVVDDVRKYTQSSPRPPRVIEVDALDFDSGSPLEPVVHSAAKTAYLQYTSGSTRLPAGVAMSHRNIMANLGQVFSDYLEHVPGINTRTLTVVSWAPFYHDMGMVLGVFVPLATGCPAVLMSPVAFMQKPARWLRHLATHRNAFTAAPNFAYDLAVARTSDEDMAGLDLSGVVVMINGAERVLNATVQRFNERFAQFGLPEWALRTTYGLAEATVYVVSSAGGSVPPTARFDPEKLAAGHAELSEGGTELVSAGVPRSSDVRIVDHATSREVPAGTVGEIWVHGGQVSAGYWRNPELTERTFGGQLAEPSPGTPTGPWLRTGDLGVVFDGELYIIGRMKDLLIVDGRNIYPDDIETTIREITGGRTAAVSVAEDTGEKLVAVVELKNSDPEQLAAVKQKVTAAISRAHGVRVGDLVLVSPGSIPVTTSGKVRRTACGERYRQGELRRLDAS